ncbi:MAG: hypothetical protein VB013_04805 [Anaerolineaceae bacterium]|nr:hypothetical protein [Anaerolineaceae bacterium]
MIGEEGSVIRKFKQLILYHGVSTLQDLGMKVFPKKVFFAQFAPSRDKGFTPQKTPALYGGEKN